MCILMMIGQQRLVELGNGTSTMGFDNFNLKQFAPIFSSIMNSITVSVFTYSKSQHM